MTNKKPDRICSDCIHFHACQSWAFGILGNTDAMLCKYYETIVDSNAYYLGQVDADKRNRTIEMHGPNGTQCPNCGTALYDESPCGNEYYFCPNCGQKLDWRDD